MNKEEKKTILVVDDTEINIDIMLELLSDDYDILVALDGEGALEIVKEDKVDLILLDIMMPEMNGYEVCTLLKNNLKTKDIPVIFITAKTDEDSIEKAYEVGGIDYVTKPFKPRELLARVKTQLRLKELICHLDFIASHDNMTGIYNRRKFFELAIDTINSSNKNLYAVMIDIDKFKNVNDTYGHHIGDKVIKLVTKTVSEEISDETIFGRIGGEEFALICKDDSKKSIMAKVENLRESISKLKVISDNGISIYSTISIGITKVKDSDCIDTALKEADIALYKAKISGRNKVIFR